MLSKVLLSSKTSSFSYWQGHLFNYQVFTESFPHVRPCASHRRNASHTHVRRHFTATRTAVIGETGTKWCEAWKALAPSDPAVGVVQWCGCFGEELAPRNLKHRVSQES